MSNLAELIIGEGTNIISSDVSIYTVPQEYGRDYAAYNTAAQCRRAAYWSVGRESDEGAWRA